MIQFHFLHSLGVFIFFFCFLLLQLIILSVQIIQSIRFFALHCGYLGLVVVFFASQRWFNLIVFFLHIKLQLFLLLTPFVHLLFFDQNNVWKSLVYNSSWAYKLMRRNIVVFITICSWISCCSLFFSSGSRIFSSFHILLLSSIIFFRFRNYWLITLRLFLQFFHFSLISHQFFCKFLSPSWKFTYIAVGNFADSINEYSSIVTSRYHYLIIMSLFKNVNRSMMSIDDVNFSTNFEIWLHTV
jgi:hypothetical protein